MSMEHEVTIKCPRCGKESKFTVWESINTVVDPEMKEKVRDGSAFQFVCPYCGYQTYACQRFLYHQMEDKVMISYCETDADEAEAIEAFNKQNASDEFSLKKEGYWLRIVRDLNAFREKLYIRDAGLDDRVIEVTKLLILSRFSELYPDTAIKGMLFVPGEEGKNYIQITELPAGLYDTVRNDIIGDSADDSFIVDQNWAVEFLKNKTN